MDEARQERLAKSESVFREVNENIGSLAIRFDPEMPVEFVCECSSAACFERLTLTPTEYERIRQDATHFVLIAGHEDIEVEQVIARHNGYVVVEKDGIAGLVAADEDPRA